MALPHTTDRTTWLAARHQLLEEEKALTRARDALNASRRRLPMVEVTEDYRFTGPDGEVPLIELFDNRAQLIVYHFMFQPGWTEGCPSCSAGAVETSDGLLEHLADRDTTLVYTSRAPYQDLAAWRSELGYPVTHYATVGDAFNVAYGVTFTADGPHVYNYRTAEEWSAQRWNPFDDPGALPFDLHGHSVFLRHEGKVFHTYSMYGRGAETVGGSLYWLDLTPLGRQEDWEEPTDRSDRQLPPEPGITGTGSDAHPAVDVERTSGQTAESGEAM